MKMEISTQQQVVNWEEWAFWVKDKSRSWTCWRTISFTTSNMNTVTLTTGGQSCLWFYELVFNGSLIQKVLNTSAGNIQIYFKYFRMYNVDFTLDISYYKNWQCPIIPRTQDYKKRITPSDRFRWADSNECIIYLCKGIPPMCIDVLIFGSVVYG